MDEFLTVVHMLTAFVFYNGLMFITILFVRVPRLILRLLHRIFLRKKNEAALAATEEEKNKKCCTCSKSTLFVETWFRMLSGIFVLFFSCINQFNFILNKFCSRYADEDKETSCGTKFALTMMVMIIINALIDFFTWRTCSKVLEQENNEDANRNDNNNQLPAAT